MDSTVALSTISGALPKDTLSTDHHVSGGTPELVSGCGFASVSDQGEDHLRDPISQSHY